MTMEEAIKICTREKGCVQGALDACADGGHYVSPDGIITALDYVEALDMAIAALREQPRWISVEERLPDDTMLEKAIIVCIKNRWNEQRVDIVHWHGNEQRLSNPWFWGDVTHWMQLPEPPEVEG